MSKADYIETIRNELTARYEWARTDAPRLDRMIDVVRNTLAGADGQQADLIRGDAAKAAWRAIGGKGKPTYVALRALPEG